MISTYKCKNHVLVFPSNNTLVSKPIMLQLQTMLILCIHVFLRQIVLIHVSFNPKHRSIFLIIKYVLQYQEYDISSRRFFITDGVVKE